MNASTIVPKVQVQNFDRRSRKVSTRYNQATMRAEEDEEFKR